MQKELITIIIPVYNVEMYLDRCLNSVANQSYKHLEIILINDGSTDNSFNIIEKYEKQDKRFKVINKSNGGVSSARNCGLDICQGKYVTFIDADDYVDVDFIETLYKKIKEYNVDIVFSNAIDILENGKIRYCKKNNKEILLDKDSIFKEILKEEIITNVCWGNMYKTDLIKGTRFDIKMRIAEDMKFLFEVISNISKVLIIPQKKYFYVVRNNSTIHESFANKWYDEINYCKELVECYQNTNFEKYTIKRYVRVIVSCLYMFNIEKEERNKLKSLIEPYFLRYMLYNIVPFDAKIVCLIVMMNFHKYYKS